MQADHEERSDHRQLQISSEVHGKRGEPKAKAERGRKSCRGTVPTDERSRYGGEERKAGVLSSPVEGNFWGSKFAQ